MVDLETTLSNLSLDDKIKYVDILFQNSRYREAELFLRHLIFVRKESDDDTGPKLKDRLETVKSFLVSRWHFPMLNDSRRNRHYQRAISQTLNNANRRLRPDHGSKLRVIDIGSGSGLLSLYAAEETGVPADITACEASAVMSKLCQDVVKHNKFDDVIRVVPKLSTHLGHDEEKFDILITETFDAGFFGEHVLEIYDHAWKNLLKSPGTSICIPRSAKIIGNLIECPELLGKSGNSNFSKLGVLDLKSELILKSDSANSDPYLSEDLRRMEYVKLTSDFEICKINFQDPSAVENLLRNENLLEFDLKIRKFSGGKKLDAICFWFQLDLADDQNFTLTNDPEKDLTCWEQALFPLQQSIPVSEDDDIELRLKLKGHLSLVSCRKVVSTSAQNGFHLDETKKVLVLEDSAFLKSCSGNLLNKFKQIAFCTKHWPAESEKFKILDLTNHGLLSLQILKLTNQSELSFYMERVDPGLIDFAYEVSLRNEISPSRISGEFAGHLEDAEYDVCVLDPILLSGKLDENSAKKINSILHVLKADVRFLPQRVKVFFQLFQSLELKFHSRMDEKEETTKRFGIHEFMNRYSSSHLQEVDLNKHLWTGLTGQCQAGTLESKNLWSKFESAGTVKVTKSGTVHGLLYFFVLDFFGSREQNVEIKTFLAESERNVFKQGVIILQEDFEVEKDDKVNFRLQYEFGTLDILLNK